MSVLMGIMLAVIYFIGLTVGLYVCALKKWEDHRKGNEK